MTREVTESYAMENGEITFVTISSVAYAIEMHIMHFNYLHMKNEKSWEVKHKCQ